MTLTLRISPALARKLELLAKRRSISKSLLVKQCLESLLPDVGSEPSAYELGADLFGLHANPHASSTSQKQRLKKKIRAKNFN